MQTLQEGQGQEQPRDTTEGETPLRQRAEEILNSLRQRKQQWRQRQQPRTTYDNDNRRRTDTPRRQGEDTTGETAENRLAIVERPEVRELQVIRRRRRRLVCRHYDHPLSMPLYSDYLPFTVRVHYIAVCCSATTGSFQLHQLETG